MADEAHRETAYLVIIDERGRERRVPIVMRRGRIVWIADTAGKYERIYGLCDPRTGEITVNLCQNKRSPEANMRSIIIALWHELLHWACPECNHRHIWRMIRILRGRHLRGCSRTRGRYSDNSRGDDG